ncbi:MAG TPA: hypothetical protein VNT54_09300, partial [Solirubrobacteraceae bacterium]|nr:hypothetical protein [Solirubrobacteraceae bacterium]
STRPGPSPLIATMLVVVVAAVVSLGRQLDQPVQLLDSTVRLQDAAATVQGVWIGSDAEEVFVGVDDEIRAIPRSTVRDVTLGPPRERAPSPSLLSRALGGNRYAITPFEWWCNGERYSWGELGDLCRTQIEVLKAEGEDVQRRDLAGDAVPVTLRCPQKAKRPCRGFLRLVSRKRYRFGPAALPKPVTFRSRLRPLGTPDTPEAGIAPGRAEVVCVPVDQGQRGLLRNAPAIGEPQAPQPGRVKRPLPFDLVVSADAEGRNVVRSEPYVVNVTRPNQPIEYWGDCATLRIACHATAGTRATADVECTVRSQRTSSGPLTVTVAIGEERYARATATMSGTLRVVRPTVTRPLVRNVEYQATALLGRGRGARKFWTSVRAR